MPMQNIYRYIIEDLLKINQEQIIVLSGLIDSNEPSSSSDLNHIEELAQEIRIKGAFPSLDLSIKTLKLKMLEKTPEDKYFVPTEFYLKWVDLIDVIIDLTFPENRNIFTDNIFTNQKKELINKSLQTIYKNMLIAEKIVLLPNFPKQSIADYYGIELNVLKDFYQNTFEALDTKMNNKGNNILDKLVPGVNYNLINTSTSESSLKITLADQQSYFISNKINNFYTVLPFGYVACTIEKSSLDGKFFADKLYYKNHSISKVEITFSYGNILSIKFNESNSISDIIEVGMINSKERVELFIGVNNGVTDHCNYNYYDRCIDGNFSLVLYDEMNNTIEVSCKSIELANENKKNLL